MSPQSVCTTNKSSLDAFPAKASSFRKYTVRHVRILLGPQEFHCSVKREFLACSFLTHFGKRLSRFSRVNNLKMIFLNKIIYQSN